MTKRKYLKKLAKALKGVPARERDDLVAYYDEFIENALEGGKSAQEVFSDLEPPETVAETYLRERAAAGSKDERGDRSRKSPFTLVRAIGGFFAVIATIVLAALILSFAAAGVSLTVAGVYTLVVSFGLLFAGHAALFFAQWGMAFAMFALAMLAEVLTVALATALLGMWKLVTGHPIGKKPGKKVMRRALIVGCAVLFGAGLMFTASYAGLGFDYKNLAVTEDLVVHEEELAVAEAFALEGDNVSLTVKRSESETCKLVYRDFPEAPKRFAFADGKAILHCGSGALSVLGAPMELQWHRGLLIGVAAGDLQRAELYLPASFLGDLDVQVENGAISIADMVCSDLVVATNNGAIDLRNTTAETITAGTKNGTVSIADAACSDLIAVTKNGAVDLRNVTAETVTAETKNGAVSLNDVACTRVLATASTGAINLSGLRADFIFLHTSTGAVKGTIAGNEADYAVEAKVSTGSCNLQNRQVGEKRLEVRVSTGSIKIFFAS